MTPEVVDRVQVLARICQANDWTVGVAESCTGGLLSTWICSQPGVSSFFLGGVVSYGRDVKISLLDVPPHVLSAHGEVSLPTAKAMASGLKKRIGCDWSVSITGIAGPTGGTADKPVGFVCFGVAGPGFELSVHQQFNTLGGREDIQRQAALFAFDFLLNAMR